jgi:superfamily I DNA/RNA helicase
MAQRQLSVQQSLALDFVKRGKGSGLVISVAGSGKTTWIEEACKLFKTERVAAVVFNKKNAVEMQQRFQAAGIGKNVVAGTFHSFGFRNWMRAAPGVQVDPKKVEKIMTAMSIDVPLRPFVGKLVSLAKQSAAGLLWDIAKLEEWEKIVIHHDLDEMITVDDPSEAADLLMKGIRNAYSVLCESVKHDYKFIDFDDQIFCPLIHNAKIWQNDVVFIDEAQDTNPARRLLAKHLRGR